MNKVPPPTTGATRAPVAHPTATVSMNTALAAVADRCSRQHVTHRSNKVRVEEVFLFFSYPRIPQNPHALPIATTLEFSREESMWEKFSWRADRDETAGETERRSEGDAVSAARWKSVVFQKTNSDTHTHTHTHTHTQGQMAGYSSCPLPAFREPNSWKIVIKKQNKTLTKQTIKQTKSFLF